MRIQELLLLVLMSTGLLSSGCATGSLYPTVGTWTKTTTPTPLGPAEAKSFSLIGGSGAQSYPNPPMHYNVETRHVPVQATSSVQSGVMYSPMVEMPVEAMPQRIPARYYNQQSYPVSNSGWYRNSSPNIVFVSRQNSGYPAVYEMSNPAIEQSHYNNALNMYGVNSAPKYNQYNGGYSQPAMWGTQVGGQYGYGR